MSAAQRLDWVSPRLCMSEKAPIGLAVTWRAFNDPPLCGRSVGWRRSGLAAAVEVRHRLATRERSLFSQLAIASPSLHGGQGRERLTNQVQVLEKARRKETTVGQARFGETWMRWNDFEEAHRLRCSSATKKSSART